MNYTAQIARDGNLLKRPVPAGPKPKKRLPKVSKRRAPQNRAYTKLRRLFLSTRFYCEAAPLISKAGFPMKYPRHATEVHHKHGRIGAWLNATAWWVPVCREAHNWIHSHPKEARELGLLR